MCQQRREQDQLDPDPIVRGPVPLTFLDLCAWHAITAKLLMMLMLWVPKAVRTKKPMESIENREYKNHEARRLYVDEPTNIFPGGRWPRTPTTEAHVIDTHMWDQFDEQSERDFEDYLVVVTRHPEDEEALAPHIEKVTIAVGCARRALKILTYSLPDAADEIPKIHPADLNYLRDPSGVHNDNLPLVLFTRGEHDKVSLMALPHPIELVTDAGPEEEKRHDAVLDRCNLPLLLPSCYEVINCGVWGYLSNISANRYQVCCLRELKDKPQLLAILAERFNTLEIIRYWTKYREDQIQEVEEEDRRNALPPLSVESIALPQKSAISIMVGEPSMDISTTEMEDTVVEQVEEPGETPPVDLVDTAEETGEETMETVPTVEVVVPPPEPVEGQIEAPTVAVEGQLEALTVDTVETPWEPVEVPIDARPFTKEVLEEKMTHWKQSTLKLRDQLKALGYDIADLPPQYRPHYLGEKFQEEADFLNALGFWNYLPPPVPAEFVRPGNESEINIFPETWSLWLVMFRQMHDKLEMEFSTTSPTVLRGRPALYNSLLTAPFSDRRAPPPMAMDEGHPHNPLGNPAQLIPDNSIRGCPLMSFWLETAQPTVPRVSYIQALGAVPNSISTYSLACDSPHVLYHHFLMQIHAITLPQWWICMESALLRSRKVIQYFLDQQELTPAETEKYESYIRRIGRAYDSMTKVVIQSFPDNAERYYPVIEPLNNERFNRSRSLPQMLMDEAGLQEYRTMPIPDLKSPMLIPAYLRVPDPTYNVMATLQAMSQYPPVKRGEIFDIFRDCMFKRLMEYYPLRDPCAIPLITYKSFGVPEEMTPEQGFANEWLFIALHHLEVRCSNVNELELVQFMYKSQIAQIQQI